MRPTFLVGIAGAVLAALVFMPRLANENWDVTLYTAFGEDHIPIREYAEERLDDPFMRPELGHDGKYFFVQAIDPWVLDPETNASVIDDPHYRYQRMLYPTLVGAGGLASPEAIVYIMFILNLIAAGVGAWVVAELAMEMGGSPWWGLAFPLNIGFLSEVAIGGSGVVAGAAAFGAVLALTRRRFLLAVVLLTLASLSRETMLIAAAGCGWWLWRRGAHKRAATAVIVPLAAVLAWGVFVRVRLGWDAELDAVGGLGVPFAGFVSAVSQSLDDTISVAAAIAILVLLLLFARHVFQGKTLLGWAFGGFVVLGTMLTDVVWLSYFDVSRAIAPAITAFVLLAFMPTDPRRGPTNPQPGQVHAGAMKSTSPPA